MEIKNILYFRKNPEKKKTIQQKALRLLTGFFTFMLLCTFLSRAADSLTVPLVETSLPSRSPIVHIASGEGRIQADGKVAVTALEGMLVKSIDIKEGEEIQAGDTLFILDTQSIQEKLFKEQLSLQKLQLQLSQYQQDAFLGAQRAQEDLETAEERNEQAVRRASSDRRKALRKLREYSDEYEGDDKDYDEEEEGEQDWKDTDAVYLSLRDAYHSAQREYEDALNKQEDDLRLAKRALQDVQKQENEAKITAIDCQLQQMEVNKLQELLNEEGRVLSPIDGIVSEIAVQTGKLTSQEGTVMISENSSGFFFTAQMPVSDAKYVSLGDKGSITIAGDQDKITGCLVEKIQTKADDPAISQVTLRLAQGQGGIGMAGTAQISKKTKDYETCVPLSAIRINENQQKYILTVKETETVLGKEYIAEETVVTIQDQNETTAAVSGPLDRNTKVIVSSNKNIFAGDRIRLQTP